MKVLITGGAGFIGSNLVDELISKYEVVVMDDYSSGQPDYLADFDCEIIRKSIHDSSIDEYFRGVDVVFHLAAKGNVIESIEEPRINFKSNVEGTFNVLEACKKAKVKHIVFSSTGGALMGNTKPPVNEESLPSPISPYGASKLACEGYIKAYSRVYNMNYTILRFGNVIGVNSSHKVGVLNKFVKAVLNNQEISVFGNVSRDLINVKDLVKLLAKTINNKDSYNETFHIASGSEIYINKLAEIVIDTLGSDRSLIKNKEGRKGEVERNFADITKASNVLGFRNNICLEQSIVDSVLWLANNK